MPEIRLIDEEGNQVGVMRTDEALRYGLVLAVGGGVEFGHAEAVSPAWWKLSRTDSHCSAASSR